MGGRRLTAGQGVDALEEAIDVIRSLWNVEDASPASFEGRFYHLDQAARGPAPAHDVGLWVGAFKPRMLNLVGRKADGWWPTLGGIDLDGLIAGNAAIDEAALNAGRQPTDIRRLLNLGGASDATGVEELARFALDAGISTFVLNGDDPRRIKALAVTGAVISAFAFRPLTPAQAAARHRPVVLDELGLHAFDRGALRAHLRQARQQCSRRLPTLFRRRVADGASLGDLLQLEVLGEHQLLSLAGYSTLETGCLLDRCSGRLRPTTQRS